jgi:hypothetical protein
MASLALDPGHLGHPLGYLMASLVLAPGQALDWLRDLLVSLLVLQVDQHMEGVDRVEPGHLDLLGYMEEVDPVGMG